MVDCAEEIERDAKEAEQKIIVETAESILSSGLEVPSNVAELLVQFEKDDLEVISKCTSLELKRLMVFNRAKRKHLVDILRGILKLLNVTNKMIWQKQRDDVPTLNWTKFKSGSSSIGIPYFKLRNSKMSCWSNADVERKRQNNELMLHKMMAPIKWTMKDKLLLKKFVAVYHSHAQEKQLISKLKHLEDLCNSLSGAEKIRVQNEQIKTKRELQQVRNSKKESYPELNSEDCIDWFEVSDQLNGKAKRNHCLLAIYFQ